MNFSKRLKKLAKQVDKLGVTMAKHSAELKHIRSTLKPRTKRKTKPKKHSN